MTAKGGVQIVLDGDEAKLFESLQKVISQEKKAEVGAKEFGRTASKINAEVQKTIESMGLSLADYTRLQSTARREVNASKSATEKYAEKVLETERQLKLGIITEQQRIDILKRNRDALFGLANAETRETSKVRDNSRALRENASARQASVGSVAIGDVAKFATAWIGVSTAVSKATGFIANVIQQVNQIREASGENLIGLEPATRRLRQVATGSDDLNKLLSTADGAAGRTGVDRATSRELLFAARSEGFEEEFERVLSLKPVLDPIASAKVAGGIRNLFSDEQLGVESTLNAVLTSSQKSKFSFEDVSRALPQASEGGALQGATLAETSATLAVIDDAFESASTAAARIKALTTKFALDSEFGLAGKGIIEGVEALQALPEKDRRKFLGESQEVNTGFAAIAKRLAEVKQTTKEVEQAIASAGSDQSTVIKQLQSALDPTTRAGRQALAVKAATSAAVKKEVATEGSVAVNQLDRTARLDEIEAAQLSSGMNVGVVTANRMMVDAIANVADGLGIEQDSSIIAMQSQGVGNAAPGILRGAMNGFNAFMNRDTGLFNALNPFGGEQQRNEVKETLEKSNETLERIAAGQDRANGAALGALGDDK